MIAGKDGQVSNLERLGRVSKCNDLEDSDEC